MPFTLSYQLSSSAAASLSQQTVHQAGSASPLDSAFLLVVPRQAVSPSPDQEQGSAQQDALGAGWPAGSCSRPCGEHSSCWGTQSSGHTLRHQGCLPLLLKSCGTGWPHTQPWCPLLPPPLGLPHHSPGSSLTCSQTHWGLNRAALK